jgi:hypothetical protein
VFGTGELSDGPFVAEQLARSAAATVVNSADVVKRMDETSSASPFSELLMIAKRSERFGASSLFPTVAETKCALPGPEKCARHGPHDALIGSL